MQDMISVKSYRHSTAPSLASWRRLSFPVYILTPRSPAATWSSPCAWRRKKQASPHHSLPSGEAAGGESTSCEHRCDVGRHAAAVAASEPSGRQSARACCSRTVPFPAVNWRCCVPRTATVQSLCLSPLQAGGSCVWVAVTALATDSLFLSSAHGKRPWLEDKLESIQTHTLHTP